MDNYNHNSIRAKKARLGKVLNNKPLRLLFSFLMILGFLGFGLFIFLSPGKSSFAGVSLNLPEKSPIGWLFLAFSILILMILLWSKDDLDRIPLGPSEDINDILSANVMLILGKNPTPKSFAENFYKTRSGKFLAQRFNISKEVLSEFATRAPEDMSKIFSTSRELRRELDAEVVSGGILAVAIIMNCPNYESMLHSLKLELSDLKNGINWYNHLYGLVKSAKNHRRDGGIARDFSFGYTPTLSKYAINVSETRKIGIKTQIHLASHREIIQKMIEAFSKGGRQNIALIGPEGSGRTTIIDSFAEVLMDADAKLPSSLKYRQVSMLDATSLISAASERGKLEGLVITILNEAYSAKNIILCLDNAQLFFEEAVGSVDISNVLMPIIDAGRLRLIFTMNEQKFLEISARNSTLANKLNQVVVEPASEEETMKIMEDNILGLEQKYKVVFQYLALKESYRLSERYIHDLAMPGRALNLLESSANYAEGGMVTMQSVQTAIEKTKGVRLSAASDESNKQQLLDLEAKIHERMIDQADAVKTVSDAIRRAAVGVRNQNRPIGTFLFLGPTGVGKTELAKSLAEVYFKGENNLIRLDMNEFVSESDVNRLIAEGKDNPESLTAQAMKQPFSVILLDEIEKAHPAVLTTLLQLLDEGILRDVSNREVSFRDSIVIATSNAGADKIREYVEAGKNLSDLKEQLINEMIHSGQFKPEFLNRFDEICLFSPLGKPELRQIVDLIIKSINKTLEPQKISVDLTEEAKDVLVERGYDPKMGARPMRRIVQKTVENLVARQILEGGASSGATIKITPDML